MVIAKSIYISASCNRASNASDCRPEDGLLAFASGRFVALWNSADVNSSGVSSTLPGHLGEVTTLKFLPSKDKKSNLFVSGDSTGLALVWKENDTNEWSIHARLQGHTQSISAVAALEISSDSHLVITGSSDGTLQSWRINSSGADLLQKIDLKGKIVLDLALSYLPSSQSIVLATGGTENKIHIYTSLSTPISFTKAISLEGHSDWVRCLSFTIPLPLSSTSTATLASTSSTYEISPGELLLASGSQDNYIRLWRFSRISTSSDLSTAPSTPAGAFDALDALENSLAEAGSEGELRVKAHDFTLPSDGTFACSSEAVLLGHDSWLTGLHWSPTSLALLSSSADRSMILWTPTPSSDEKNSSSIWTSSHRFGEFSSATNLGFFGALWGVEGRMVLASGWGGAWHVWRLDGQREGEEGEWEPVVSIGGHFGKVKSLGWEPEGEYLMSAGDDMTTRLHAPWRRNNITTWHELGRPQIHGYPIASIAFTNRLQFVSGADEKIVRVFDAPKVFLSSLKLLSLVEGLGNEEDRPMAANVPPLGLSNRAIANATEAANLAPASADLYEAILPTNFTVASHPPFEEQLLGSTLWPEIEKLYGHGYEIISLCAAHSTPLIAVACKATSAEHAVIRMYSTETWKPTGVILEGHALSITSMKFSGDDRFLLSVSRDRTWRVYERFEGGYKAAGSSKSHARIIWDACWTKDDQYFVTASRDKTAKVWTQSEGQWICAATIKTEEAATSVATTLLTNPDRHLLAVGLENGQIHLFTLPVVDGVEWTPYFVLNSSIAHVLSVTSLAFKPKTSSNKVVLASGSEDKSVRIIEIVI